MKFEQLRRAIVLALLFVIVLSAHASGAPVFRDLEEVSLDLSGNWKIAYDPENVGLQQGWFKSRPAALQDIAVPSCFEETREGAGYDGVVWYYCNFAVPQEFQDKTLYLHFGAVNYACRVWLNGVEIGGHEGGYHRFRLSLGSAVRWKEVNELVVRVVDPGRKPVDGLTVRSVPNAKESWYFNFGGIYRPVHLLGKPSVSIEDVFIVADPATGRVALQMEIEKREGAPADVPLQIKIVPVRDQGKEVASTAHRPSLNQGKNDVKIELHVANPELWSPENPFLYRVSATVGKLNHTVADFGFRSFAIENGEFRLNGKPIFLRGVLYQPYYPGTLAYPPSEDFVRREIYMMKEAGFNMVRCHAGVAPPILLRLADEIGLMVLEEPSLGWVYGRLDFIGKPSLAEVTDMVRRDFNHPSIVAWGTISQGGGDLAEMADLLARRALQMDGTRPVFGDWPARWAEASARVCSVYLPGNSEPLAIAGGQMFLHDPMSDEEIRRLSTLGTSSSLVFVSAIGSGGMTNLRDVVSRFGGREFLEDYRLMKRYLDSAEKDFSQYRLQEICGSLDGLIQQVQGGQRDSAAEMIETLRANPNMDGYCYSQWRDAAWECGGGVVDVWGNGKRVVEVLRRANESPHIVLRCTPASTGLDRPVRVQATIIHDGVLSGQCRVEFAFNRADGRELPRQKVEVSPGSKRVTSLEPIEWRVDGPTGFCRVRAELYDATNKKVSENEQRLLYVSSDQWDLSKLDLMVIEPGPARRTVVVASGVRLISPPGWPRSRIVLAPANGPVWQSRERFEPLAEVLEEINHEGGTLLLDCSGGLDPALSRVHLLRGKTTRVQSGFMGKFFLVGSAQWFNGFRMREAMSAEYRAVIPQTALLSEGPEWHPQVAIVDGYGRFGGVACAERHWGAGRVVAFTLPIFDLVDRDPAARLICSNILRYCAESQRIGGPGELDRTALLAQFEGRGEAPASEWWICGPFACRAMDEGLRHVYPPESEFEKIRTYPGLDKHRPASWVRYSSKQIGRINFTEIFGERQNAVAYALTHVYAKKQARTIMRLGSDDGVRVFLNGRRVFESAVQRSAAPDQDRFEIVLEEGWNLLLIKVVNSSGVWEAHVSMDEPLVWSPDREMPAKAE